MCRVARFLWELHPSPLLSASSWRDQSLNQFEELAIIKCDCSDTKACYLDAHTDRLTGERTHCQNNINQML